MRADLVAERDDALPFQADPGPGLEIEVVRIGDEGVEAVVAARELEDDEDRGVLPGHDLGRAVERGGVEGRKGVGEKGRDGEGESAPRRVVLRNSRRVWKQWGWFFIERFG